MEVVKLTSGNQEEIIALAINTLENGGLVVYPTETTYGIGADCENPAAVAKLLSYKSKRDGKPLSVAVADIKMAEKYAQLNETARKVYQTFLPGPVTVVSKAKDVLAPGVASRGGTVGIRIPAFSSVLKLIAGFGHGITATGANASYQKRPYAVQDIFDNISDRQKDLLSLVIDVGELPHNEPSTVIDTTLDDIKVVRFGALEFAKSETIEASDVAATETVGAGLISRYRSKLTYSPLVIALTGKMGAGKTHFTKGIARGLGIHDPITSPTYALANEYEFQSEQRRGLMVHVDTWKMEGAEQLIELRLSEYLKQNAVIVIEWADRFAAEIKKLTGENKLIWVDLETTGEHTRKIILSHN